MLGIAMRRKCRVRPSQIEAIRRRVADPRLRTTVVIRAALFSIVFLDRCYWECSSFPFSFIEPNAPSGMLTTG
jgi:hypothetical protein